MSTCEKCGGTIKLGFSDCTCPLESKQRSMKEKWARLTTNQGITIPHDITTVDVNPPRQAPLEKEIREECMLLADFLVEKNRAYGNSASEPCRIFAKRVDPLAQIDVRIDDKLNRIAKGREYPQDDTIIDLAGYLILRRIVAAKQEKDGEA